MGIVLPGGRLQRGVPELEQRESMRADKLQAGKKKKRRAAGFARPLPKLPIMENSDNRRSPDARLAVGHFLGHVENELRSPSSTFPSKRRSLLRKRASLPTLPQAMSSDDLRLGRFGNCGGSSPS